MPVVIAFDVSEQRLSGFRLGRPAALMDQFDLQGVEETLHRGIVVAITGAAHRGHGADRRQVIDIGTGGILHPRSEWQMRPGAGRCR